MMRKSSLEQLIQDAGLVKQWHETRTPLLHLKDTIFAAIRGPLKDADLAKGLTGTLYTQMSVSNDPSVLTIHVTWSTPESVQKIAQAAQSRFFELKRTQELAAIQAAVSLNEEQVTHAAEAIDRALATVLSARETRKAAVQAEQSAPAKPEPPSEKSGKDLKPAERRQLSSGVRPAVADATPPPPPLPDKKLAAKLAEIRQQIAQLEGPWQRRLAELKFQLVDLRGTFGPEHPTVLQQDAKIREASVAPPELAALRASERQLLAELETTQSPVMPPPNGTPLRRSVPANSGRTALALPDNSNRVQTPNGTVVITEREEDPILAPAKANLNASIVAYGEATKRLENARIQYASAQVALQNRYVVVSEPDLPKKPSKPNRPLLVLGAIFAGAVIGFLFGAIRDFLSGRVFEPWQVRGRGLPLLGEVDLDRANKY